MANDRLLNYKTLSAGTSQQIGSNWKHLRILPASGATFTLVSTNVDTTLNTLTACSLPLAIDELVWSGETLIVTANSGNVWLVWG